MVYEFVMFKRHGEWVGKESFDLDFIGMHDDTGVSIISRAASLLESTSTLDNVSERSAPSSVAPSDTSTPFIPVPVADQINSVDAEDEFLYGEQIEQH